MSESSLPPFGPLRNLRRNPANAGGASATRILGRLRARVKDALLHVSRGVRRGAADGTPLPGGPSPDLESRAARLVREYLEAEATDLERAERLGRKAERLEESGTPSESARNQAERARREVAAGLVALRDRFAEAARGRAEESEERARRAFDRVVEALCPAYGQPPGQPLGGL